MSFETLRIEYLEWVKKTFPDETVGEQFDHLKEEMKELLDRPLDGSEYADVLMLMCCVADRMDIDIIEEFRSKLEENRKRTWEKTERGYRHCA